MSLNIREGTGFQQGRTMRLIITAVAACALALPVAASAASPKPPLVVGNGSASIKTFGTGIVKHKSDGSWVIKNDPGEYGGIYYSASPHTSTLSQLHYSFKNLADGQVAGGAPRWSIPIDTDSNTTVDNYAFLDVNGCGGSAGVNTAVSTDKANCHVNFASTDYANWAAFYTAHPGYKLATDGNVPFIISDQPGKYHITKPVFG